MDRKEETKAVKRALNKFGINARVGHGRGTAWGWLEMNVGAGQQYGEHITDDHHSHAQCPLCPIVNKLSDLAEMIAQDVTGRHGAYGGNISVHTQNHWTDKKGSIEIRHDITADQIVRCYDILKAKHLQAIG